MKVDGRTRGKAPLTTEQRELCGRHLGLAEAIASKRKNPFVPPEDRLQDAYMGLIDAARDYDPADGEFGAFAYKRILGSIVDGERARSGIIRTPRGQKSIGVAQASMFGVGEFGPLNRSVLGEDVVFTAPDPATSPDDVEAIDVALRCLSDRQRYVVARYFFCGKSQKEIAREVEICESRVSQTLTASLDELFGHSALADYRKGA